ncbi:MAG: PTS glucose transporter subunit IIA [Eubacteriales bacterium]
MMHNQTETFCAPGSGVLCVPHSKITDSGILRQRHETPHRNNLREEVSHIPDGAEHVNGGIFAVAFDNERDGDVVSPVRGIVTAVEAGGGSVFICSEQGLSVQVEIGGAIPGGGLHPGKSTVHGGDICHVYVQPGDAVQPGQRLLHAELARIRLRGGDTACVVTVADTDADRIRSVRRHRETGEAVRAGQTPVMEISRR